MRIIVWAWRVALVVILLATFACGGGPTAPPTNQPVVNLPAPTVVYAPPPAGVSAEVWRVAFAEDARMRRPDAVVLVLPSGVDEATRAVWREIRDKVEEEIQGKTPFYLDSGPANAAVFNLVEKNDGNEDGKVDCAGSRASACTFPEYHSSGKIVGGKIEFGRLVYMKSRLLGLHEAFRAMGMGGNNPNPGIMNVNLWSTFGASNEERLMLRGRYDPPLLAVYTAVPTSSSQ